MVKMHAKHWPEVQRVSAKIGTCIVNSSLQFKGGLQESYATHWPAVKRKSCELRLEGVEKARRGAVGCTEFWTHPETVACMKGTGNSIAACFTCVVQAILAKQSHGSTKCEKES